MMPTFPSDFARFVFAYVFGWGHWWLAVIDDLALASCVVWAVWRFVRK